MPIARTQIITLARTWLGTPYHHQARTKNVGTDCLGLILGVYHDLYGTTPKYIPNYTPDWAEAKREETMLSGARKYLIEQDLSEMQPGDVAVFRLRPDTVAKHAAIVMPAGKMIHAMEGTPVSEVNMTSWWRKRIAATFQFPGVE